MEGARSAGSVVQAVGNGVEFSLGVHGLIGVLGRYCLNSPLVFSQEPRYQWLWGSQKYTITPVLAVSSRWRAISLPWS